MYVSDITGRDLLGKMLVKKLLRMKLAMLIIGGQQISYSVNKYKAIALYVEHCWQLMKGSVIIQQNKIAEQPFPSTHIQLKQGLTRFLVHSSNQQQIYQAIFQRWLLPKDSYGSHDSSRPFKNTYKQSNNRIEQVRSFRHWYEVALALDGWLSSKKLRQQEQSLARNNYQNPYLNVLVNNVIYKLYRYIQDLNKADSNFTNALTMELLSGQTVIRSTSLSLQLQPATAFGRYRAAFSDGYSNNPGFIASKILPLQVLKAPQQYSLKDKIITLLDLSEYFGEQQAKSPETAGQWLLKQLPLSQLSVSCNPPIQDDSVIQHHLIDNEIVERGANKKLLGLGGSNYCRDETAESTLFARKWSLPLCAGHSIAVSKVLNLAVLWGHCNVYELTALSHALAAFWRIESRPTTVLSCHTLHEVFDIAKNFGVDYQLLSNDNPTKKQVFDKVTMGYLCLYIDETYSKIKKLLESIEQELSIFLCNATSNNRQSTLSLDSKWQDILGEKKHTAQKLTHLITQMLCQNDDQALPTTDAGKETKVSADVTAIQAPLYNLLGILNYLENLAQLTHQTLPKKDGQIEPSQ